MSESAVAAIPSWQKKNPRHEAIECMKAMAEARRQRDDAQAQLLDQHIADMEFLEAFAEALGIATEAPDWWDISIKKQREKLIARATMLRARALK